MRAFLLTISLFSIASPALACQNMEGDVYDDLSSPGFAVAVAEVTDLTITKSSDAESCFAADYLRKEVLFGEVGAAFRAETCGEYGPITVDDFLLSANEVGLVEGATVMVGLLPSESGSADLRHAIPDCWGPFHVRLDLMSEIERDAYVADIKASLLEADAP